MRPIPVVLVALVTLALTACGGDEADPQPAMQTLPTREATDTAAAPDAPTAMPSGTEEADTAEVGPGAAGAPSDTRATPNAGARRPAETEGRRLYTIQVAAFLDAGSADAWVDRLRSQGWPVWSSAAEVQGRTFHRVRVGGLPSVDEARRLGNAVSQRYGWPVWLAPVTAADRPPANVVEATRLALSR